MRQSAEIVQFQKKQEAKFICSACGADRGCDCNAPAVEKLAELKEKNRIAARESMRRKRKQNQGTVKVNTDEMPTDEQAEADWTDEEIEAEVGPMPTNEENVQNDFVYLAGIAKRVEMLDLNGVAITKQMREAAKAAAKAWAKIEKEINRGS
jgi:hypothetical protein